MYFPTKFLRTYPQTPIWGPFNAKPIIQRALRQSHVNRATTLKLYGYIGIGKYFWSLGVSNIFRYGASGGTGPLNVNLRPPIISETTGARKLKLKTRLHVVKYSLRVQKFFY